MKRKWWLMFVAIIAAISACLCFFTVWVHIAPRLVLSRSLNTAFAQLESRFEKSPVHLFVGVYDPEGCYQADLQLETNRDHVGPVRYDMDVQTQLAPLRIMSSGTVVAGGKALDLSLYLDGDFAAVSSQSLVEGNFYGITYDRFSPDIRSRELLAALIGDEMISQWENDISGLDEAMSLEIIMPEYSLSDIRTALYAVLVLKPQVGRQELLLSGETIKAHTISFRATGQQILRAAEPHQQELTPQMAGWIQEIKEDPEFYVDTVFYLDREKLIMVEGKLASSQGGCTICVRLGDPEKKEPLMLQLEIQEGEDLKRLDLTLEDTVSTEKYQEQSRLTWTHNGVQQTYGMDYIYDLSSGEMDLCLIKNGKKAEMRLHLAGEGEKITITSQNIAPLLDLFREKPMNSPAICTLSLMPGQEITAPEYKNLDQWSGDDLWMLLKGLGTLLGIKL